ncbi:MAG: hypothetical protein OEN01_01000 [Candidatus Krumholzibacteria bacterium]|nr:hypothetical protein [Candidatus Krumholzibacteria bacterium]
MFVFFGTRSKLFPGNTLQSTTCEGCGSWALKPYTIYKYFHVFWVPCVPFKKELAVKCTHCGRAWRQNDVSPATRAAIEREKKSLKPPAYLFAGAFILVLFLAYVGYSNRAESWASDRYFASPVVDDLYIVDYGELLKIDEPEYHYGVFKINRVGADSIRFRVGTYGYRHPGDARTAIKKDNVGTPEYFYEGEVAFSKAEMLAFFDERHVKKIIREK